MYSRAEASQLKQNFWIAFGKYLSAHRNSEGFRINWVNYNTGYKNLYFRMNVTNLKATIAIEIAHPDIEMQELFYEYFLELKTMLHNSVQEEWQWQLHVQDDYGKTITRIGTELKGVNIFNESEWPQIISFLKPRIIALDEFWNNVKDRFEELKEI
jgi:hypothetical protein